MPFTFTTDAAYPEQFGFDQDGSHVGYLLHDYGAGVFSANPTFAWTEPSPTSVAEGAHWFGSAGAVSFGAVAGYANVKNSQTLHVPVTGTVNAGQDILLAFAMISDLPTENAPPNTDIAVTDNKGGNVLRFGAALTLGFGWCAKADANGVMNQGWTNIYRINTQLISGDTITVSFTGFTVYQVQCRLHVVSGLNDPNPNGPNAGGNYVEVTTSQNNVNSPQTWGLVPAPNWVGPTSLMALVIQFGPVTYQAVFARGGLAFWRAPGSDPTGKQNYEQNALCETILDAGCSIEIGSANQGGTPIPESQIGDVTLWVEDL